MRASSAMSSRKAQQSLESIRTRSRAVAASADYRSVDTCSLLIACTVWHRSETETSEAKTPIPSSMAVELFDGTTWYVVHPPQVGNSRSQLSWNAWNAWHKPAGLSTHNTVSVHG